MNNVLHSLELVIRLQLPGQHVKEAGMRLNDGQSATDYWEMWENSNYGIKDSPVCDYL